MKILRLEEEWEEEEGKEEKGRSHKIGVGEQRLPPARAVQRAT